MSYRIVLSPSASKALNALPQTLLTRIGDKIFALAEDPRPPGTKTMQGAKGSLRLRVSNYRVIYQVEDDRLLVRVIKIGHRREIYRKP